MTNKRTGNGKGKANPQVLRLALRASLRMTFRVAGTYRMTFGVAGT